VTACAAVDDTHTELLLLLGWLLAAIAAGLAIGSTCD
jgi:hypothetical protein